LTTKTISLALENTALRSESEKNAAEAERSRLARDLHDAVTQTLFSASLIAEVLPRIWEQDAAEGERRLEELRRLTRGALAEMRTLLVELRPSALVEADLRELLGQLLESAVRTSGIEATLSADGCPKLPSDVQVAFYRIAQEALNNIAKHSGAKNVEVALVCGRDGVVRLMVADDGRGFGGDEAGGEHLGLRIMRERAASVDAVLRVTSEEGRGTSVEVEWRPDKVA
jgi:signal transduction histidine kinase